VSNRLIKEIKMVTMDPAKREELRTAIFDASFAQG